ncbi:MAG: hypothetical protein N3G74_00325 [Candidatus Micrarchaeota archaeon]|nr:hypothetical protein [Candidatus Micrarchaeota archaeon]
MQESNSKFSFKARAANSLDKLESAAKKLKDKVKISTLDDNWFKKINYDDYSSMAKSIEEWIRILEHAEQNKKRKNTSY